MAVFFEKAKLKNTLTGQPITSMDDFNAWKRDFGAAKLQKDLKDGTLTPETLDKVISESPSMQRIKQLLERNEQARQESENAAAQAKIDAELQEINKLDSSIRTIKDLLTMPEAKEFYEYVRRGNTFIDAFHLINRKRQTAETGKQQPIGAVREKSHLRTAGTSRGAGAAAIPAEEMKLFKLLNPQATEAEIQAYYNKSKQKE